MKRSEYLTQSFLIMDQPNGRRKNFYDLIKFKEAICLLFMHCLCLFINIPRYFFRFDIVLWMAFCYTFLSRLLWDCASAGWGHCPCLLHDYPELPAYLPWWSSPLLLLPGTWRSKLIRIRLSWLICISSLFWLHSLFFFFLQLKSAVTSSGLCSRTFAFCSSFLCIWRLLIYLL